MRPSGYLIDAFPKDSANRRTDRYGGPIDNRSRLPLEIVDAASAAWSADRVGVRLSPWGQLNGHVDAVAVGRQFIVNPDRPERFRTGAALNRYDRSTFNGGD